MRCVEQADATFDNAITMARFVAMVKDAKTLNVTARVEHASQKKSAIRKNIHVRMVPTVQLMENVWQKLFVT